MRLLFITLIFLVSSNIYALDKNQVNSWLKKKFNLDNYSLEKTNAYINNMELYIAYNNIKESDEQFGIFDKAILFVENNDHFYLQLAFNGPVILNPNGTRPFDFSTEYYKDLDFYGWEIALDFYQELDITTVYIAPVTDNGESYPDSLGLYYDNSLGQFCKEEKPWNVYKLIDVKEPLIIGIARNGMPDDDDEFHSDFIKSVKSLSAEELKLCRNAVFALYGYNFKSDELKSYFHQFNWYFPGIKEQNASIVLDEKHKELVDYILSL